MINAVVRNKLSTSRLVDVHASASDLTEREALIIGQALPRLLITSLTTKIAVDQWHLQYPALQELQKTDIWFVPMVEQIAKRLLQDVGWGMLLRVCFSAALSYIDVCTDVLLWCSCIDQTIFNLRSQLLRSLGQTQLCR